MKEIQRQVIKTLAYSLHEIATVTEDPFYILIELEQLESKIKMFKERLRKLKE